MEGRICPHCGTRHFSTQPCSASKIEAGPQPKAAEPHFFFRVNPDGTKERRIAVAPPRMFDRNAYQREYMRNARAQGKYKRKNPD